MDGDRLRSPQSQVNLGRSQLAGSPDSTESGKQLQLDMGRSVQAAPLDTIGDSFAGWLPEQEVDQRRGIDDQ